MALEGNLSAFGLSEILQLIAVQQKSGMLSVTSEDRSMVMFFRDGSIVSTRDRRRRGGDPLKDFLTRYGILSQTDLIRIMDISVKSKLDMTEVIISENFLSEEELRKHYRNQIQEAVHEMLTWEQCSYKFIPSEEILAGMKTWGEFNIEGILMESMRRIDEFPQMFKEFPEISIVITRSEEQEPEDISTNERIVLDLLDKEQTIDYLVAHGKMPVFEVYEALKHLKEKELIDTRGDELAEDAKSLGRVKTHRRLGRSFKRLVVTGFVFSVFFLSLFIGFRSSTLQLELQSKKLQYMLDDETLARHRMEQKLRWILEGYLAEHGRYPTKMSMLHESKFVTKEFMDEINRFSFRYRLTPGKDNYTLL